MIITLSKKKIGIAVFLLALIVILLILYFTAIGKKHKEYVNVFEEMSDYVLVIDPGHGGADGGATSVTGVAESVINLQISEKLEILAAFYGIPTVMTRTSESIDYPSEANTIREKKVYDTQKRVETINAISNAVLISIHQNIFESSSVCGIQVIYADTTGSAEFADYVQDSMVSVLQPSKTRNPVKVNSNVYIMNHIKCPAVLVECGFLSNYQDDQLLQSSDYQIKIAASLLSAYILSTDTKQSE